MELIEQLTRFGIDPQSYLLLKAGLKPVIRTEVGQSIIPFSEKISRYSKIFILVKRFDEYYDLELTEPLFYAYTSLSEELSYDTYEADMNQDRKKLGKLLGYPDCCVDYYLKEMVKVSIERIIGPLLNTKTKPSFYCNSIFNFDSKVDGWDKIFLKGYEICRLFLIRHMPCSFDCKESIKIGKKTLELLERELPELAKEIVSALKRPVLYFDYFNWIVFDGEVQNNELQYKQVLPYKSLFPKDKLNIIKQGNRLEVLDDKILISKDDKLISNIDKEDKYKGVLIDFL